MADYSETDFFADLSLVDDPYPYFEHLRARGAVSPLPHRNVVAVVGFEEALSVHVDTQHFSAINSVTGPLPPIPFTPEGDDITAQIEAHRPTMPFGNELLTQDPPEHTPLRSLLMRLFTPRRLRAMEPHLVSLADQLLDEILDQGRCEFIGAYASPFALLAIADLLGVPEEDRPDFRRMMGTPPSQVGASGDSDLINPLDFRKEKFLAYIEDRRAAPRDDILGELANATYSDGSVPDPMDVVRAASLLFGAGQDTTATLLGAALHIIAQRPDLQAQLRVDPALIPDFLEEVLRIAGPVKTTYRLARKPTVLGGQAIAPGTTVMITTSAVNRDPRRFDAPAEFRLARPSAKDHLAFGRGAHTCPGAALARTEARISLQRILERTNDIRLDAEYDRPFSYAPSYVFRALKELHLEFE
jgi:cytochrome P450